MLVSELFLPVLAGGFSVPDDVGRFIHHVEDFHPSAVAKQVQQVVKAEEKADLPSARAALVRENYSWSAVAKRIGSGYRS